MCYNTQIEKAQASGYRAVRRILALLFLGAASLFGTWPSSSHPIQPPPALASAAGPYAQPRSDFAELGQPNFRLFTDTDGLPLNSVMALALDQKKYVWAGTQDGAAYYNGRQWTSLRMPKQGASNFIHDVLAARDGSVWFATDGSGIFQWKDGEWRANYDAGSGLPTNATRALLETTSAAATPVIWVGTREGLARLEGGKWQLFTKANGLPDDRVRCLMEAPSTHGGRAIWVGTYEGLARYENGQWQSFTKANGLPGNTVFCLLETVEANGARVIWAGTDAGLARLENDAWTTIDQRSGLPVNIVRSLLESTAPDGTRTLWVGTDSGGLARFVHGQWTVFDSKSWLPNDLVWDLLETGTNDGALWAATLGGGIVRLETNNWRKFDTRAGLPHNITFSFLESGADDRRAFWIGSYGGGLLRFENGVRTVFNTKTGLPDDFVHCLTETTTPTGEREVWAGTEVGLGRFRNGRWTNYGKADGLPVDEIWDLLPTTSDTGAIALWIATADGLAKFENEKITRVDVQAELLDRRLRTLHETRNSAGQRVLWVGTYTRGLAKLENGQWTMIDTTAGLPNNRILDITETSGDGGAKWLWVGTGGGGAARLDLTGQNAGWETISSSKYPAMLNDYVYQVRQDGNQRIYLTTNKGVVRLTPRAATAEDVRRFDVFTFTTEDGLPSNECNAGASWVDRWGRIWVGTVKGAAMLDPMRDQADQAAKPLYVERVLIRDQPRTLAAGSVLGHEQNKVKFEFALLSHYREANTRYRTQMIGLEAAPTEWDQNPFREFNYLPAGDYVFQVWGRDHAGNISGPVAVAFSVRPAPWRTWWAFLLYGLGLALVGAAIAYGLNQNRVRRLLAVERVRTRIATDLHDDIGASLSQIAVLSEVAAQKLGHDNTSAARPLERIAETSRELVQSMSDVVWSINPQRDHLRDLLQRMRRFATDVFTARNIEFTFNAPATDLDLRLDVDLRRQIYLIFKECVNNIVRHAQCTRAEIEFNQSGGWLTLRIQDDGRGFEVDSAREGNGLGNLFKRAQSIGGTIEIHSQPGRGTEIILNAPHTAGRFRRLR